MNSSNPTRIVLVDDHALVREGIRALLAVMPRIEVVGEAESAAEALELLGRVPADLLLLDIGLKDTNGLELTRSLGRQHPDLKVLILSMYDNIEYVRTAIRAGACGYVLKDASSREIVAAIEAIAAGGSFYSSEIARKLAERTAEPHNLTPRECQILQMLAQGLDSKAMARELDISVRTVETHRLSIRRKLNIDGSAALIRYALSASRL
ncbi:response regulator [Azotobacter chroococcum]|jgi:DNA-binding NarL/FixJ family response regulator|uniref:Response regulator containing a CheY-like receiver domain and an HTH DNA-binding domain n=2 Tax=Azotobacter chroococcum TaxID=353 RepID=A0A0C4WGW6_9GAMM|nr:response regulator transcription factor [Azotobacter chroococcum]AJE20423.1 Response regulator containing a CheY-like receiver domain and an HTH DNA-binding domain [Azotobacter chroococcum NCIMB 8003]ASL25655.1 LuxR family transcriptional regulator [Azotobacter chroococcum]QQE89657.1 response regulator transcription factor [Azotobacter chroococcum]TBV94607.1 response regulator transcription factor [Azotobacter chroococcum]TBW10486.1 response regulator transcription factor [Azotobacter chroo